MTVLLLLYVQRIAISPSNIGKNETGSSPLGTSPAAIAWTPPNDGVTEEKTKPPPTKRANDIYL